VEILKKMSIIINSNNKNVMRRLFMNTHQYIKKHRKLIMIIAAIALMIVPVSAAKNAMEVDASTSKIVRVAYSKLGSKYIYGASHSMSALRNKKQRAFDCSGFVSWVYYQSGHNIGVRTTSSLRSVGRRVSWANRQKGDILLFGSHTGIYIGNNKMIHAPNSRSRVRVEKLSGHWRSRLKQVRRVVSSSDKAAVEKTISKATNTSSSKYTTGNWKITVSCNVRAKATASSKKLGRLKKGSVVTVKSIKYGRWAKISFKGKTGWVSLRGAHAVRA
jgi:uncharacterized protein YraI